MANGASELGREKRLGGAGNSGGYERCQHREASPHFGALPEMRGVFSRPIRGSHLPQQSWIDTGLKDYSSIYELQLQKHKEVVQDPSKEVIILTEHHPVYTVGRRAGLSRVTRNASGGVSPLAGSPEACSGRTRDNSSHIPIVHIERGGGVTYHGPGQIVGYPILHLEKRKWSIPQYLRWLEETLANVLADFGVATQRRPEFLAGLWVGDKKLVSIGIAVRHWVTFHGFALNVDCDLAPFRAIQPCGLRGDQITSLQELGVVVDKQDLKQALRENF